MNRLGLDIFKTVSAFLPVFHVRTTQQIARKFSGSVSLHPFVCLRVKMSLRGAIGWEINVSGLGAPH
jgi:hypothetical protein